MNCFPCFHNKKESPNNIENNSIAVAEVRNFTSPPAPVYANKQTPSAEIISKARGNGAEERNGNCTAKTFTFRELAMATKTFRQECLLGEGGFGRVFKGTLQSSGQIVAVRQLDRSGTLESKEFLAEVSALSLLQHPNLVKIIGFCADGDQRLLVYEYMPSGSLNNHLFDLPVNKKPLDWSSRMKIAAGIAEGIEYLHGKANPPIIYRDLKSSNVLLDESNNPRLSEYGLAKLMQSGNKMHVSPRVMGGYGYCAPEYETHGELTLKSDVYSFGVVLLELITGRRAMDTTRPINEQNLVSWAQPIFSDTKNFPEMADPLLKKQFPATSLNQAVGIAAMCLQDEPMVRPLIEDIVAAVSFLALAPPEAPIPERLVSILSARVSTSSQHGFHCSVDLNVPHHKKECTSEGECRDNRIYPNQQNKDGEKEVDGSSESESSDDEDKHKVKDSKTSSRRSRSRNSHSSSIGSRDFSVGFSSRGENRLRQDTTQEPHDFSSSSDEESSRHSLGSCSQRRSQISSRINREEISMRSNDGSEFAYSRNSSSRSSSSDSEHGSYGPEH